MLRCMDDSWQEDITNASKDKKRVDTSELILKEAAARKVCGFKTALNRRMPLKYFTGAI